jgi:hypothetical protein
MILAAWSSFLWLDWKILLIIYILYTLQMIIFKGCILINWQTNKSLTKETDMTMYAFWAEKFGYKVNRNKLKISSKWIMPVVILLLSLLWQILLNHAAPIKLW